VRAATRRDPQGQIHALLVVELRAHIGADLVGDVAVGDVGHRLRPGQRGALALGVVRRLAPGVEPVEALLGLAAGARILRQLPRSPWHRLIPSGGRPARRGGVRE
jgi:hypothetical protein